MNGLLHEHRDGTAGMGRLGLFAIFALALLAAICLFQAIAGPCHADQVNISGAGATFPMPVLNNWIEAYNKTRRATVSYRGIGSGGGIAHIKAKTVDFGASDNPLDQGDLEQMGLVQFPIIMGGVVPVVHIKGIQKNRLKLTPEVLADIYLGKIRMWNDRRIRAINSDLSLPDEEIVVVHRADGSGTTYIFTTYLSKVSKEWKENLGASKEIRWPTGVGGKGNPGVAGLVKRVEGSIGYVEYAYAVKDNLATVQLQNREGAFVKPSTQSFQAAAQKADWKNAPGFVMDLTNQAGDKTWPIVGVSYILIQKDQPDAEKAIAMLTFFDWAYKNGNTAAESLHYVPMPSNVVGLVKDLWGNQVTAQGVGVWKAPHQAVSRDQD